ncbi:hypothetical protein PHISCL_01899 [Aspergillus sclerotialis]|uniref:Uncharacterized protein n=1 Tax=Aspergillus sclerotialis TaxID=2070753 RepID=A0A3A2ZRX6_9EURO|nr:hypothetical protein PHISCL_01899 [Aspergillus sclerotialis]
MRRAFRLPVGQRYFKVRAPNDLFYELDDYDVDELDWESFVLWYEHEDMIDRTHSPTIERVSVRKFIMTLVEVLLVIYRRRLPPRLTTGTLR